MRTLNIIPNLNQAARYAQSLMDRNGYKDSIQTQSKALANDWLKAYDKDAINYRQASLDYKPTLYSSPKPLEFRTELPDRFQNLQQDSLASQVVNKSLNQLLNIATNPKTKFQEVLNEAKQEAQRQFGRTQKQIQQKRRQEGVSYSGRDLLHSLLANQNYINNFAEHAKQIENQRQAQREKSWYDLANYGLKLEQLRGESNLKKAEQQSKRDALEAELFNKQKGLQYETARDLNRNNTQLQNEAQKYNQQIQQRLADKNVDAAIQQKQHLQDTQQQAFKNAYQQQLNKKKFEFDRLHKLLQLLDA